MLCCHCFATLICSSVCHQSKVTYCRVLFVICHVNHLLIMRMYSYVSHQSNVISVLNFSSYVVLYVIVFLTASLCIMQSFFRVIFCILSYIILFTFFNIKMQFCQQSKVIPSFLLFKSSITF